MTDLEHLDAYLSSGDSPERCLLLSDLDGFLHGVACSPMVISAQEWMQVALGAPPETLPPWVLETVGSLFLSILDGLSADQPEIEPFFWRAKEGHVIAMDWCEGFMQAVKLRSEAWEAFTKTREGAELMLPILIHMIDSEGNSMFGIPQGQLDETLDRASQAIPAVVPVIFQMLRPQVDG